MAPGLKWGKLDIERRNRLVVENLPLVGYLVSDLCARATHLSRDDLAAAGALALVLAADAFDEELGVPFGAFARRRIQGAFLDDLRAADWATRSARKRIKSTLAVVETLTASLGRTPTSDEIAAALGSTRAEVDAALADAARTVSTIDETVEDRVASATVGPEEATLAAERSRYLAAAVRALPEIVRVVVEAVYLQGRTVKDVAAELGVTHAAVSQRRAEGIRLLRDGLAVHYADDPAGAEPTPSPQLAAGRRSAYLGALADLTTAFHRAPSARQAPVIAAAG